MAAISALVAIVGVLIKKEKGSVAVEGDGTVVGNNATVLVDRRQGIGSEFPYSETQRLAEVKGILEVELKNTRVELEYAKKERDKAVKRVERIEAQGNRQDAEQALREMRETGDMTGLQRLLIGLKIGTNTEMP